jgi:hypothetical protein
MIGRVPCAGPIGIDDERTPASAGSEVPKTLPAPAARLLASDARKNLRRVHSSMTKTSSMFACNIQADGEDWKLPYRAI